jgi:hypothetical protein
MPVIRVSAQVDQFIRRHGKFGDSHDSILRRLLGFSKAAEKNSKKQKKTTTPDRRFRHVLLKVLLKSEGHKLPGGKAIKRIEQRMKGKLTAADLHAVKGPKAGIRWKKRVHKVRANLVKEGLLQVVKQGSRSIWKLTPKGAKRAKAIMQKSKI